MTVYLSNALIPNYQRSNQQQTIILSNHNCPNKASKHSFCQYKRQQLYMLSQLISYIKEKASNHPYITSFSTLLILSFIGYRNRRKQIKKVTLLETIGSTPLIYLPKLSKAANCHIYAKMEYLNPFGSSKDRAVLQFLNKAADEKELVEASSGSTAISLVQMGHILNKKVTLFLPDDLAEDKYLLLETLKATIVKVPPVSIVDPNHFFNLAQEYSKKQKAYFTNQFQNLQNTRIHFEKTGPEIYNQTNGLIDAFICSAGTGGSIAGVSQYLKSKNKDINIVLADPQGSGLFNKVKYNVLFTRQQKEGYRLKNPFDTIIEGVGLNRPTKNFDQAIIDDAIKITDIQALHTAHYLIQNQGIFVGGSSALNVAAAIKYGRKNKDKNLVVVLHDSGIRYLKKFYSKEYLLSKGIKFDQRQHYDKNDLSFIK